MSPVYTESPIYIESIRVEGGRIHHLDYHQQRVDRVASLSLHEVCASLVLPPEGCYKLRLTYSPSAVLDVSLTPYVPRRVTTLRLVVDDTIEYATKRADRSALNRLHDLRGDCDDVLIVRNGFLTDTSYCNLLLGDGSEWVTPDTPLLPGTCRARLIAEGLVRPLSLRPADLSRYPYFLLVNALLDFNPDRKQRIEGIIGEGS